MVLWYQSPTLSTCSVKELTLFSVYKAVCKQDPQNKYHVVTINVLEKNNQKALSHQGGTLHGQQTCKETHVNIRNFSRRSGVACCLCYVRPACHAKVGLTRFLVCQILMEHLPPQLLLAKSYNMRYKKEDFWRFGLEEFYSISRLRLRGQSCALLQEDAMRRVPFRARNFASCRQSTNQRNICTKSWKIQMFV